MAYVVAVYFPEQPPAIIGPFDTGLEAGDFARQLPAWLRWHTLCINTPGGPAAQAYLLAEEPNRWAVLVPEHD